MHEYFIHPAMKGFLPFVLIIVLFTSCQREDDFQIDSNTYSASDHVLAERCFNELSLIADIASNGHLGNYREVNDTLYLGCGVIIRDTTASPKTISVDYGSVNCLCQDGRNRRGKIISSYSGNYSDSGTVITHTTVDYYVNDNKISGTKTVTNNGLNANNNSHYSEVVSGSIVKANNSGTITWSSNRERIWTEGESTSGSNWQDDVYTISGTANGISSNGVAFSALITSPLRTGLACSFISSGKIEFSPANRPIRFIDFGTGVCDNLVTVTINGNNYNIGHP